MASLDERSGVTSKNISLEEKVAFLKNKENYPHSTKSIKTIKTHMSWVFLTDQLAYKLKIPFRYDHMRLLTPESRYQNCLDEVRLNNRLANEFYIGVVPLSIDKKGNLKFGQGEKPVDWLVKMKRLPEEQMLEYKIKNEQSISQKDLEPAVNLLTQFYKNADPIELSADEYKNKMISALRLYRDDLCSSVFGLPQEPIRNLYQQQLSFIEQNDSLFTQRVTNQKIVEGHGDLKPDHICLSPPAVIDCLEFDEDLRILDVFDDLAFLSLECDRLNASWVGDYFIRNYCVQTGDSFSKPLLDFYKSCKAYIRALLSIRHIREKMYRKDPKWRDKTLMYLELSAKYIKLAM